MTMITLNHLAKYCTIIFIMMAVTINAQTDSSTDFLNTFWKSPYELNNHKFSLELEKIYYPGVISEILDTSDVYLLFPKVSVYVGNYCNQEETETWYKLVKSFDYINKSLPTIEILRNKFVIFDYSPIYSNRSSKESENFLMSVSKSESKKVQDHYYNTLQMFFEAEESENSQFESKDITWNFYVVEDEIFLGLTGMDIERIGGNNPLDPHVLVCDTKSDAIWDYDENLNCTYRIRPIYDVSCDWIFRGFAGGHLIRRESVWIDTEIPWMDEERLCKDGYNLHKDKYCIDYIFLFKMNLID